LEEGGKKGGEKALLFDPTGKRGGGKKRKMNLKQES